MLSGIAAKTYDALARRLRKIDDRDDFVLGVIANAETVENWQSIIEFIDNNPAKADYETVLAYSVLIDDGAAHPRQFCGTDGRTPCELLRPVPGPCW